MKAELGLTDEQSEKLRRLFSDERKASIRARADLQVKRMELHEIMMGDKVDREAALKKVAEISDLRAQLMRQHVETMLAAKGTLTPEQQKKAQALMAERWSRRGEGLRDRPGLGRGPGAWRRPGGPAAPGGGVGGPSRDVAPRPEED
jgi:Spy/CpxP family protein refolding chaperone